MPSISRLLLTAAAAASLLAVASTRAQSPTPQQALETLASATALDAPDTKPWHLRMSYQLYDLKGKPSDTGTIEQWWEPYHPKLRITSASHPDPITSTESAPYDREAYLVEKLLSQVVHPIPAFGGFKALKVYQFPSKIEKVSLTCFNVSRDLKSKSPEPFGFGPNFCVQPGTNDLRLALDSASFLAVRNHIATFRNISIGLDNAISYNGTLAITGHVDVLEGYQPTTPAPDAAPSTSPPPSVIPGIVLAGKILKKQTPIYPDEAKMQRLGGTVLLCALISKQGTITFLDVVSSPAPSLSQSALDAVKRWTYQPYLLNGQPTEVQTTITVNYNLNGGAWY
jgi:TonB family protein